MEIIPREGRSVAHVDFVELSGVVVDEHGDARVLPRDEVRTMSDLTRELVTASERGDLKAVEAAITAGADVNLSGPNGNALHCAAFGGFEPIARLLIESGAAVDAVSSQGFSPMQLAASKDHAKLVKLLGRSAPLEQRTAAKGTALHVAAASGALKSLRALLDLGADIDAKDENGRTPMMAAAAQGELKVVKELIKRGANLEVRDSDDLTAVTIALTRTAQSRAQLQHWSSSGEMDGVQCTYTARDGQLLYQQGSAPERPLGLKELRQVAKLAWAPPTLAPYLNAGDCVLALAKAGADVHCTTGAGLTFAHSLAHVGELRLMTLLAKDDPFWSKPAKSGVTPLHFAAKSQRSEALRFVLERATSSVDARDQNGYTPLHFLCDVGGPVEMFDLLLAAGADHTLGTTKALGPFKPGSTPADVAAHWNDTAAVQRLAKESLPGRR